MKNSNEEIADKILRGVIIEDIGNTKELYKEILKALRSKDSQFMDFAENNLCSCGCYDDAQKNLP